MTPSRARGDVERFARGEPVAVEIGAIERHLAELWKQARSTDPAASAERPVSRAALWNVVVVARGRESLATRKQLVDEMAPALPTRAITLCIDDAHPAAEGGARRGVEATVESNVVSHPGGGQMVYSEEITLVGPPGCEPHFGALVRGLCVAGVPTATFWLDPAVPEPTLGRELLPITDRLVLDTTACLRPRQLFELDRIAARAHPLPVADLGWLRLGGLRSLFAGLFDPPVGGGPLARATRLDIRHLAGADALALMFVAWLGVRLGWRPLRASPTSDGGIRFELARGEGDRDVVEARLIPDDGPCGKSGILAATIEAENDRYAVHRTAFDQTRLETPVAPPRVVKIDSYTDAELAVAALGPRGRDPLFVRCLAFARQLWSLEPTGDVSRR
jgi:glucose-6-phosphate dehydrogenase assembly protein OpcA